MGRRIYVGNLPFNTDEEQLKTLFEEGGRHVESVKLVTDRDTGRSRGFAFVEMATDEEAAAAITALNGRDFGGRALTVSEARERPARGGPGADRGGPGADRGGRPPRRGGF